MTLPRCLPTIALALALAGAAIAGCPARAPDVMAEPDADADPSFFVGTWAEGRPQDDATATEGAAIRLGADGVFERGRIEEGRFVAEPNQGPSGPDHVMRYAVDPAARRVTFFLDGAEETVGYRITAPDRWEFVVQGDVVPRFFVRR